MLSILVLLGKIVFESTSMPPLFRTARLALRLLSLAHFPIPLRLANPTIATFSRRASLIYTIGHEPLGAISA